jgi:lysozyme
MSTPTKLARRPKSLIAAIGVAAALIVSPLVTKWESGGKQHLTAYRDIVGIWTICDGDTSNVRPGMVETPEGCERRLEAQLVAHAEPVLRCTPGLRDRPNQLAAAVSLAYNIGTAAYCRSTVARRFNAGDVRGGCDAFLMWTRAGGRVVQGLVNRRRDERSICLRGLA